MVKKKGLDLLTSGDRAFLVLVDLLLFLILIATLFPIVFIVSSSFSSPNALMSGRVSLLPVEPTLQAYEAVFADRRVGTGFLNSIIYASLGTSINLVLTLMAGYALSRRDLPGRNLYTILFVITMFFSGGIIPTYLVVLRLGLVNTRLAMVLPRAISVWNVIITRAFFQSTLPDELLESARIDGCSDARFVVSVVVPLSSAIIAVNILFYAVAHWNRFFDALIYLYDNRLYPLQLVLRSILINNQVSAEAIDSMGLESYMLRQYLSEAMKYALIVVATVPVACVYPFVQRHFVKGVMIGSLKG